MSFLSDPLNQTNSEADIKKETAFRDRTTLTSGAKTAAAARTH